MVVAIPTTVVVSHANDELAGGASRAVASTSGYQFAFCVAAAFAVANLIAPLLILHRHELRPPPPPPCSRANRREILREY